MQTLQIDIVSDVSCPWCIIGYKSLQQALDELKDDLDAKIQWHAFELNPNMPPAGQDVVEHLMEKYQISAEQCEQNRQMISQRGDSVGYEFIRKEGARIYNTFDAHRLLMWAKDSGKQTTLKLALFDLYFQQGGNPSDHQQLLTVVDKVGLDTAAAKDVLNGSAFQDEVRAEQQLHQQQGIQSVPAFIINQKYLISGGQPADAFIKALSQIASENN